MTLHLLHVYLFSAIFIDQQPVIEDVCQKQGKQVCKSFRGTRHKCQHKCRRKDKLSFQRASYLWPMCLLCVVGTLLPLWANLVSVISKSEIT